MKSKAGSNNWIWSDGRPFGYANWAPGLPNNYGGNQDNIAIRGDGQWDDVNGKTGAARFQPFICKIISTFS